MKWVVIDGRGITFMPFPSISVKEDKPPCLLDRWLISTKHAKSSGTQGHSYVYVIAKFDQEPQLLG